MVGFRACIQSRSISILPCVLKSTKTIKVMTFFGFPLVERVDIDAYMQEITVLFYEKGGLMGFASECGG